MNTQAQQILSSFEKLPDPVKYEIALEILRRTKDLEFPPLSDDELVTTAEDLFLELDKREQQDENSESR